MHLCCHSLKACVCSALYMCGCTFLYISVFALLYVHTCICLYPHICACTCVFLRVCVCSVSAWGSICVRLTRWEPLSAGSPGGPKSSGRPEAWNPSRPGQMSLCSARLSLQRPHRPLKTFGADFGSQNADQTVFTCSHKNKPPPKWIKEHLFELNIHLLYFNQVQLCLLNADRYKVMTKCPHYS